MGLGLLGAFTFSVAMRYVMTGWFFSVAAWGLVCIMVLQPLDEGWWSWIDCSFTHSPMFIVTAVSLTVPCSLWLQFHYQPMFITLWYYSHWLKAGDHELTAVSLTAPCSLWLQFHSQSHVHCDYSLLSAHVHHIMILQPLAEGWWSWIDCSFTHSPMFIVTAVSLTVPYSLWLQFHYQPMFITLWYYSHWLKAGDHELTAVSLTAPCSLWLQFHSQSHVHCDYSFTISPCSSHYDTTATGWRLVIMNWLQFHSQLQCSLQVMTIRHWSGTSSRCRVPLKIRFWPTLPGEKSTRFSGHQRSPTGSPSVTTTAWRSWEFDYDRESRKCEEHDRM